MPTKAKEEKPEAKASLPPNHPKAGYLDPDLSFIDNRGEPEEGEVDTEAVKKNLTSHGIHPLDENTHPRTREENISKHDEEVDEVGEAEDKAAREWLEAEEEAAKQAEEARQTQLGIQAKAGLVPAPTPTAGEIVAKQSEKKSSS